jgi:hypothetical protein
MLILVQEETDVEESDWAKSGIMDGMRDLPQSRKDRRGTQQREFE